MRPRRTMTIDEAALEARVTARVLARLIAALGGEVETWPRTSARADAPRGVSPRRWCKVAREIGRKAHPGARLCIVERRDWEAYLARTSSAALPAPPPPPAPANDPPPWSPTAALLAAGLRPTR